MKLFNVLSWITIGLALTIISVLLFWNLYDYKTVDFEVPHKVLNENNQVKSGGYLIHEVRYCKYTTITPIISKYFEDGILYLIPDQVATHNELGCSTNMVYTYIPKALIPGTYVLRATFKYRVNPIREIDVFTETELFEIVEAK